jgi:hypothetical protein
LLLGEALELELARFGVFFVFYVVVRGSLGVGVGALSFEADFINYVSDSDEGFE